MQGFTITMGSMSDLDVLVEHRMLMWSDIHPELSDKLEDSRELTRDWIAEKISDGTLFSFIVKNSDDEIAGSGCIVVKEDQPRPGSAILTYPYLLSMYTISKYRGRGVASLVVESAVKWSKTRGYDRIILHASNQGRNVYEKFGFQNTNEMKLKLL